VRWLYSAEVLSGAGDGVFWVARRRHLASHVHTAPLVGIRADFDPNAMAESRQHERRQSSTMDM
jgi:hypothetical protein